MFFSSLVAGLKECVKGQRHDTSLQLPNFSTHCLDDPSYWSALKCHAYGFAICISGERNARRVRPLAQRWRKLSSISLLCPSMPLLSMLPTLKTCRYTQLLVADNRLNGLAFGTSAHDVLMSPCEEGSCITIIVRHTAPYRAVTTGT